MYNDGKIWSKEHCSNKIGKIRNVLDLTWKKNELFRKFSPTPCQTASSLTETIKREHIKLSTLICILAPYKSDLISRWVIPPSWSDLERMQKKTPGNKKPPEARWYLSPPCCAYLFFSVTPPWLPQQNPLHIKALNQSSDDGHLVC